MPRNADRYFIKPATAKLRVQVSEPGTKTPADATVTLTSLRTGGASATVATTVFTRQAKGDYVLIVPTADLLAGTYDVLVTVADGPEKVAVVTDRFVVQDA